MAEDFDSLGGDDDDDDDDDDDALPATLFQQKQIVK